MTGAERAELEAGRRRIVALHQRVAHLEAQLKKALEDSARGRKHELELEREVAALRARDAQWEARLEALESKLMVQDKNSANSSVPPSADPARAQRRYPQRLKTERHKDRLPRSGRGGPDLA